MKKKIIALVLCLTLMAGIAIPGTLAVGLDTAESTSEMSVAASAETASVFFGQEYANTVSVPVDGKSVLSVGCTAEILGAQWQIYAPTAGVWANIYGETGSSCAVSYAMIRSMLDGDGLAKVRCLVSVADGTAVTQEVSLGVDTSAVPAQNEAPAAEPPVVLSDTVVTANTSEAPAAAAAPAMFSLPQNDEPSGEEPAGEEPAASPAVRTVISEAQPIGEPVIVPADAPSYYNAPAANSEPVVNDTPANDVPADETPANDTPTPTTYAILINYQFTDGRQAAPSWSATVATGSTYTQDIQSPVVVGYTPDETVVHVNTSEAKTYTVTYQAAEVDFTVKHYQQNVSNDEYTLADTETKKGYTESAVGAGLAKTDYTGFYSLLYDTTTTIAADGSTVVEIYYDRSYYLLNFDLDGGYGVEPIYARYGAPISVGEPTKPGYAFGGWSDDGTSTVTLPSEMPAMNKTYKAIWTANDTAKVTVVFWGENADDEEYSYIRSMQIDAKPGESYSFDGSTVTCPLAEHSHNDSELNCTHTHTLDCYYTYYEFTKTKEPSETLTDNGDGIYTFTTSNGWYGTTTHYYLNIGDDWYCGTNWRGNKDDSQSISFSCKHTHTDECYDCGLIEHTHSSACDGLWTFVKSDTVAVAADGSSVVNVYYDRTTLTLTFHYNYSNKNGYQSSDTITAKWGADIGQKFLAINSKAKGNLWSRHESGNSPWTSYLQIMPKESRDYYCNNTSTSEQSAEYYTETLTPGKYELEYTVTAYYGSGLTISEEDFYPMDGFTYDHGTDGDNTSMPKPGSYGSFSGAKFYYTRNSYTLTFNDGYNVVKTESVKYEAPLSTYSSYKPAVPSAYEPGSVTFGGWYLNPECTGVEYKLDEHTMPADNVLLYAKWVPVTHTVEFYLNKAALDAGTKLSTHPDITVPHGSKVDSTPATPENGSYPFVGWFYMENGVEKAFDFANMPVNKDLKVYGKWSINVLKTYTVKYAVQDTDGNLTYIAPDTTGSALAGTTKTFEAKTGDELNKGYRSGYFPQTASHSMTVDIEGNNEYTFIYVPMEKVNYTVKYLNKDTGTNVFGDTTVDAKTGETSNAVITETFVPIKGYAPDAYQKRLVLSADEEQNVITFWYVKDNDHAPVQIIHWTQNIEGEGYTEYQSSTNLNGVIGTEYSETPLTIAGFRYNGEKSNASGKLTEAGLVLNLYYDRIEYPYEFRFVEKDSNPEKQLADSVTGSARYQAQVTQTAKTIPGYTLVSAENQAINIAIEDPVDVASKNVKIFYYTEQTVEIKYEVVGPTGCGTLDNYQESQLKVITGTASGSVPTANENFRFVGWYTDKDCLQPVDAAWVGEKNKLTPVKAESAVWTSSTYYAKFEYNLTSLTITKSGGNENDSFIFDVKKDGEVKFTVSVKGNSSVTIAGLIVGETYTVTERGSWSWRYKAADQEITLKPTGNNVTIQNRLSILYLLDGSDYKQNNAVLYNKGTAGN